MLRVKRDSANLGKLKSFHAVGACFLGMSPGDFTFSSLCENTS